jgi:tetratricopeptide (TPR) repeat protein
MLAWLNSFIDKILSKNTLVLATIFCVTFLAYGNILFGGFVFDDNIFIENNTQIRSPSNIALIYSSSTTAGSGLTGDNFYRPNQQFIYTILYSVAGLSPALFHLVCLLFHILNAYLIFLLFTKLGLEKRASLFASLLFAVHPILTEAVSYVSGLSEPLVATSILLTILFFLKAIDPVNSYKWEKWLFFGAAIFTLGLFSKENQVIALPLIIIIWIYQYKRGEIPYHKKPAVFAGVIAFITIAYLVMRVKFLNFTGNIGLSGEMNPYTTNLWVRITTFIHIFPQYIKMMLWPWRLNYEKPYDAFAGITGAQSWTGFIIILTSIFFGIRSFFKKSPARAGGGKIFLGVAWFFVALLPVSGIIPLNAMYLEHWLYIPIIGFLFMVGHWFEESKSRTKEVLTIIFIIILALFSLRIFMRNLEWGDPVKFYNNELKYTQSSARIYNNIAMAQSDAGDCGTAVQNYQKAITLNDSYPQTHHNLGRCYEALGKYEDAANEYLAALYIQPNFPYSLNALYSLFTSVKDKRADKFANLINKYTTGTTITREDINKAVTP